MASATNIAADVLSELNARKGYDALWDSLDPETQDEIKQALTQTVRGRLERVTFNDPVVRIQRRTKSGQLWKVLIEDEGTQTVINLPVMGVGMQQEAHDPGRYTLTVGAHRVRFEEVTDEECGYGPTE